MNETKPTGKDYVGSDGLYADVQRTMQLAAEMNTGWHTEEEVREYMRQITGSDIPDTVRVFTPFHINYSRSTTFGKESFVNFGLTWRLGRTEMEAQQTHGKKATPKGKRSMPSAQQATSEK